MQCLGFRSQVVRILSILLLASHSIGARAGSEKVLHEFVELQNGASPQAGFVWDSAGDLFGTTRDGGEFNDGVVFELIPGTDGKYRHKVLYSFTGGRDGRWPYDSVTLDAAGNLWGTAAYGGKGCGTVFELKPVHGRWEETTVYAFRGPTGDGCVPIGGVTFSGEHKIFGTTSQGGNTNGFGTVFMLSKGTNGNWTESVLYEFPGIPGGWAPLSKLAIDKMGRLYGVTINGGSHNFNGGCSNGCGMAFMLTPPRNTGVPWTVTVLYDFGAYNDDGAEPFGGMILDASGNLYGTTLYGGQGGTVFELSPTHHGFWKETIVYDFSGNFDGSLPYAGVVFDKDGNLYGTTYAGGQGCSQGCGTVFELSPGSGGSWTETEVYDFSDGGDGGMPYGGVVLDRNGTVYGTTSVGGPAGLGVAFKLQTSGGNWNETVLFGLSNTDGAHPAASLIFDGMQNLYGTTEAGGSHCGNEYGCGTAFKLIPDSNGRWTRRTIHQFAGPNDGQTPAAGLVLDQSGNLYGTTSGGGASGGGTVFELVPTLDGGWNERVLYNFRGDKDGGTPTGPLILDSQGNLYGTASQGGNCPYYCYGVVFELSPSAHHWKENVLYRFTDGADGANPSAGLVFDSAGNLYGTAPYGGAYSSGAVFMLSPDSKGWTESTIYTFTGQNGDGAVPLCTLLVDGVGNLFGTTDYGGLGWGTVFELSPSGKSWAESVLYEFTLGNDGGYPVAGVVFDDSGNLYGTTEYGKAGGGYGTVFELSPSGGSWTETVLYSFAGGSDGSTPAASLVLDGSGTLYGTTLYSNADGVVFSVTP